MKRLEKRLKEIRFSKGKTQMDLYLDTEINHSKISWIENGYVLPKSTEKIKIANALGVSVEEIWPND